MERPHFFRHQIFDDPRALPGRVARAILRRASGRMQSCLTRLFPTGQPLAKVPSGDLQSIFSAPPRDSFGAQAALISDLSGHVLRHEFNLLGSGWIEVGFPGGPVPGLKGCRYEGTLNHRPNLNRANERRSAEIASRIPALYRPIDWQRDFISGFRWSETTSSTAICYPAVPGADIKVPWEIGRLQHLPWLAWAAALADQRHSGFEEPDRYVSEYQFQVMDFIAANPPRFGCQWMCTMDVAIRAANLVLTDNLFQSLGFPGNADYNQLLKWTLYEHACHIADHLEWNPHVRGNHYYADLAGLIIVAAALPPVRETNRWLEFSVREFLHETDRQFLTDGANFEGSTAYHRLSTEILVFTTLAIRCLPAERWQQIQNVGESRVKLHGGPLVGPLLERLKQADVVDQLMDRIAGAARFCHGITRPDGRMIQIGDNDSGRFIRLLPHVSDTQNSPAEDHLNLQHLQSAIAGFFEDEQHAAIDIVSEDSHWIDASLVRYSLEAAADRGSRQLELATVEEHHRTAARGSFPDFGFYILENSRGWVGFRCGPVGQAGYGGHAHNDQLSFELCLDGSPLIVDPGTFNYTALPDQRNRFRSTARHNTLMLGEAEQNPWIDGPGGLFQLRDRCDARLLTQTSNRIVAVHDGYEQQHRRELRLFADRLEGSDQCLASGTRRLTFQLNSSLDARMDDSGISISRAGQSIARIRCSMGDWSIHPAEISPGYGKLQSAVACSFNSDQGRLDWTVDWSENATIP